MEEDCPLPFLISPKGRFFDRMKYYYYPYYKIIKMYNHIFNSKSKTITSAAGILAAAALISGILGLFRDRLLAGSFGAGDELDIYYAAFRIPDFISFVLIMGAISAAIIPIFSERLVRSHEQAWRFFSNLVNLFFISLIVISAILIIFVPQILSIIVPGFTGDKK